MLIGGVTTAYVWQTSDHQQAAAGGGPTSPGSALGVASTPAPEPPTPPRSAEEDAIQALLDARAAAVMAGDRAAFLATVDPRRERFRRDQSRMLDNLAEVPLTTWSYELKTQPPPSPSGAALPQKWGSESKARQVVFRHRLRGADTDGAGTPRTITFTQRAGRLYVADDQAQHVGGQPHRYLWEEGPVESVSGQRSLVLGHPGQRAELRRLAAEADAAVPRVSAVWGKD